MNKSNNMLNSFLLLIFFLPLLLIQPTACWINRLVSPFNNHQHLFFNKLNGILGWNLNCFITNNIVFIYSHYFTTSQPLPHHVNNVHIQSNRAIVMLLLILIWKIAVKILMMLIFTRFLHTCATEKIRKISIYTLKLPLALSCFPWNSNNYPLHPPPLLLLGSLSFVVQQALPLPSF